LYLKRKFVSNGVQRIAVTNDRVESNRILMMESDGIAGMQ